MKEEKRELTEDIENVNMSDVSEPIERDNLAEDVKESSENIKCVENTADVNIERENSNEAIDEDISKVENLDNDIDTDTSKSDNASDDIQEETPSKGKKHKKEKKPRLKKVRCTSIGGQAVIEGVMMRGATSMATCVREPNGKMTVESYRVKSIKEKNVVYRIPFIRGIFNFGTSMVGGVKTLMRSAEVYAGEEEATKTEKWLAKKFKINIMDVVMGVSVVLGLLLSIGLFFFLPLLITEGFKALDTNHVIQSQFFWNFIDGCIRMLIFVGYVWLTSLIKDVRRTFMYHGAEHKTISCYEHGLDLTVENAQKMTTIHDRCGTTFMFLVMVISIVIFSLTGWQGDNTVGGFFLRFVIRLALLPVVAGVSYEILKFLARFDNPFVRVIKWPGLLLQKLTTKQPTDDMLECAICAFKTVMEMDADQSIPEQRFDVKLLYNKSREEFLEVIGDNEENNARLDWILVSVLGVERSELETLTHIKQSDYDKVMAMVKELKAGRPLQHIIGDTSFYGYTIKTDSRALIPRPETEYLVEAVGKEIKAHGYKTGIDMCTGTGAIAIALTKNNSEINKMLAVDVSDYALELARENISLNECDNIDTIKSDLFSNVYGKYDFIVSNPPYIKTQDIENLDKEVKSYEPMLALDGGESGLDFYRRIIDDADKYLNAKGLIAFEVGIDEANDVAKMLEEKYDNIEIVKDLEGIDRIVKATLK